jgi:hypothetical protein
MIQIESITIRELRGIRELEIKPNRKNFVVSGPNGSGKSGVVDAIQFAMTGEISRLTGKGTGGLTVQRHGPHVDRRNDPAVAEVCLRLYVPDMNKTVVLTRNVKTAKKFRLEPEDPAIRAVIEEVAQHPELTLSRREIIKFIIVEAGQRSKEIQALLKLDEIGAIRGVLKTVRNKLSITHRIAKERVDEANDALRRHLDLTKLSAQGILAKVNPPRLTLGLPEIRELKSNTRLSSGLMEGAVQPPFNKQAALRNVEAMQDAQKEFPTLGKGEAARLVADLDALDRDPELLEAVTRRSFVERGLALVDGQRCPLCDVEWEDEERLIMHLKAKVTRSKDAEILQTRLLEDGATISEHARSVSSLIGAVESLASTEGPEGFSAELSNWSQELATFARTLGTVEDIATQRARLEAGWIAPPVSLGARLGKLAENINAKPDQSAFMAAQSFLTVAEERLTAYRNARREERRAGAAVAAGRVVYNSYCDVSEEYLTALYDAVEDDFSAYYREINADDEGGFKAKLEPVEGKLDLEVAFYDKGMFPPGAYHSEGHQDGMGVCLYLALMKRQFNDRFSFAVLDDVVMSVDQGHRKEFCRLLKTRFPDTQFIITTHDKVWAKQMQTEGLVGIKGGVTFQSWSLRTGPIVEEVVGVWDQVEADTEKNDIDTAAARLRRHVEYIAGELADRLGAKPAYRGDFSYDLGDLLPAVIGRHGDLLKLATKAANSWNDEQAKATVETMKTHRSEALAKYGGENWVVNKAIHYNDWAGFSKAEFRDVVEAFKTLLVQLRCPNGDCESWLYVTPRRGDPEALRCRCGAVNVNLTVK